MQTEIHPAPEGAKPCFISLKRDKLTVGELARLESAITWLVQHDYAYAEDVAAILGSLTGREMYCDQPYYNAFAWRAA